MSVEAFLAPAPEFWPTAAAAFHNGKPSTCLTITVRRPTAAVGASQESGVGPKRSRRNLAHFLVFCNNQAFTTTRQRDNASGSRRAVVSRSTGSCVAARPCRVSRLCRSASLAYAPWHEVKAARNYLTPISSCTSQAHLLIVFPPPRTCRTRLAGVPERPQVALHTRIFFSAAVLSGHFTWLLPHG
jgi:hypothetical protein